MVPPLSRFGVWILSGPIREDSASSNTSQPSLDSKHYLDHSSIRTGKPPVTKCRSRDRSPAALHVAFRSYFRSPATARTRSNPEHARLPTSLLIKLLQTPHDTHISCANYIGLLPVCTRFPRVLWVIIVRRRLRRVPGNTCHRLDCR